MKFYDRATFSTRSITDQGYLSATAKVGRPGVQEYVKGVDFPDSDLPAEFQAKPFGSVIKIFRPPAEVFNTNSMKSFEAKPVTDNHPAGNNVNAANVKQLQVGFSKSVKPTADGEALEATVLIQDKDTIRKVQNGKDQISLGYDAQIDFTAGDDTAFGIYDAVMRNITGNHIAIVDCARAGADFRLNDNQPDKGKETMAKTRVIDGKSIELSDDAAAIFDQIKADNDAKATKITELETTVTDSAAELETVRGERDAAKANVVTDQAIADQVAERVKARVELVDAATKVVKDADFADKSDKEIRLEVIKTLGDGKVTVADAASDEYINAVYGTLMATHKPKAKALGDGLGGDDAKKESADAARKAMVEARAKK